MNNLDSVSQIYIHFGVTKYVRKLTDEKDTKKLEQLNRIISKYIISKAVDDIPPKNLNIFEAIEFKDCNQLVKFFEKYIDNFSNKIIKYGSEFQQEFAKSGIIG